MTAIIRPEQHAHYSAINNIHQRAFGQVGEAQLVEALRAKTDYIRALSLVAQLENRIVGHILFSPIKIISSQGKVHPALALAPMSVLPDYQGLGIGSQLVRNGLERCERMGHHTVVVLGHSCYYPRFGFERASLYNIYPPFDCPDEAFMVWSPFSSNLKEISGQVEYPEEFGAF